MGETRNKFFQKGLGVFTCDSCGKKTRGDANYFGVTMCRKCIKDCEEYNAIQDKKGERLK